jgi:hypothetical protein
MATSFERAEAIVLAFWPWLDAAPTSKVNVLALL